MLTLAAIAVAAGFGTAVTALFLLRGQVVAAHAAAPHAALARRFGMALEGEEPPPNGGLTYRALEPLFVAGGRLVRRFAPKARVELIRKRIVYAGLEASMTVEKAFSYRAVAAVVGAGFGGVLHPHRIPALIAAVLVGGLGSFVPDLLLDSRARRRQQDIARALPDALDLLALTVEAGLGLEQGMAVVNERLRGPLGDELNRLLREVELGVPRRQALQLLRARTDVPELSAFVVALLQAEELGVSVGEVLKVQAAQVRLVRTQRAREQAAKTPVKILFPLILGIFPAIFVVSVGPGAVTIARTVFHH